MTWLEYAGVFVAFFVTHSVPLRPTVRRMLVDAMGRPTFGLVYSALSLAMLGLLIHAAGRAPYVMLWPTLPWHYHAVQAGMLAVCLILALAVGRPNPFSFGGARNDRFDPARPGIVRHLRHPVLAALALWAGLHLLPNGDLAHLLLFGTLGAFAIAGRQLIDRRKRREMGADVWAKLWEETRKAPIVRAQRPWTGLAARVLAALAIYGALVAMHPVVIGVSAG